MALTYEEYYRRYLDDLLTGDPPIPIPPGSTPQQGEIIIGPPGPPGPQGSPGPNGAISLIQDEGINLPVRSTIDFIGAGVVAADDSVNNRTTVTITGTAGGVTSFNTRTGAVVSQTGDYSASQVTNAVDSTQAYINPAWIISLPYSKLTGTPTIVNTFNGRSGTVVPVSGDYTAAQVTNAIDSTQTYANPAWITSLAYSKLTGAPTLFVDPTTTKGDLIVHGASTTRLPVGTDNFALIANSGVANGINWAAIANSFNSRTGAITPTSGDYTAAQVTNAVSTISTYADPAWITSLSWSKLTGIPATVVSPLTTKGDIHTFSTVDTRLGIGVNNTVLTADSTQATGNKWAAAVNSFNTRTGAVTPTSGDYTAAQVTNAADTSTTYSNPAWITALAWSKITGAPAFLTSLTPWTTNISAATFNLLNTGAIGIGTSTVTTGQLNFGATTGDKITFFSGASYGIGVQGGLLQIYCDTIAHRTGIGYGSSASFTETLSVFGANVGIGLTGPTHQLQLSTDDAAKLTTNTWTIASGAAVKQNVKPLRGGLEIINKLEPVEAEYNGKANTPKGQRVVSFIAEEIREILPHTVTEDSEGNLGFNIHEVLIHMVLAIKQLSSEVEKLKQPHLPHLGDFFKRHA